MDKNRIHETINQLVEALHDQRAAQTRLRDFQDSNAPPPVPREFKSLHAFLDFYGHQQDYENGIRDLEAESNKAKEQYDQARYALSQVLPTNVPLYYTYEGDREELRGWQYVIMNMSQGWQGQITLSATQPTQD
jgi:hypothetical protein